MKIFPQFLNPTHYINVHMDSKLYTCCKLLGYFVTVSCVLTWK